VHDRVRLHRQQLLLVGGGSDAEVAPQLSQLAGVLAVLVGVGHPHAHQLEVRVCVDARDRVPPDGPGRPDDDLHGFSHDDNLEHVLAGWEEPPDFPGSPGKFSLLA